MNGHAQPERTPPAPHDGTRLSTGSRSQGSSDIGPSSTTSQEAIGPRLERLGNPDGGRRVREPWATPSHPGQSGFASIERTPGMDAVLAGIPDGRGWFQSPRRDRR